MMMMMMMMAVGRGGLQLKVGYELRWEGGGIPNIHKIFTLLEYLLKYL
jgi:hypothetical protein